MYTPYVQSRDGAGRTRRGSAVMSPPQRERTSNWKYNAALSLGPQSRIDSNWSDKSYNILTLMSVCQGSSRIAASAESLVNTYPDNHNTLFAMLFTSAAAASLITKCNWH